MVRILLDGGANPNGGPRASAEPLLAAVANGEALSVQMLLDAGADPDPPSLDGATARGAAKFDGPLSAPKADEVREIVKAWPPTE